MVSVRCKIIVKQEVEKFGLICSDVQLGRVDVAGNITEDQLLLVSDSLNKWGLEILRNKKAILVERIKVEIISMVHYSDLQIKVNFSEYLRQHMGLDYTYLANVFSEIENITIERYIILQKVERVKELLGYNELSLTEISWKLNYSSIAHLSTQFKKITGLTPSQFKKANLQVYS